MLDETDSGLDIDALNAPWPPESTRFAKGPDMGVLIITHYQRILHMVEPSIACTIMYEGRIVKEGGPGARR